MIDSPYPSLRWSRVLGVLLLVFAVARLTPWVSLGISLLSADAIMILGQGAYGAAIVLYFLVIFVDLRRKKIL